MVKDMDSGPRLPGCEFCLHFASWVTLGKLLKLSVLRFLSKVEMMSQLLLLHNKSPQNLVTLHNNHFINSQFLYIRTFRWAQLSGSGPGISMGIQSRSDNG